NSLPTRRSSDLCIDLRRGVWKRTHAHAADEFAHGFFVLSASAGRGERITAVITPPFDRELEILNAGEMGIVQQLVESSNIGFVVDFELDDDYAWAVYKPEAGEQPLWDFPPGLYKRERAAFVLSEYLGWHIVPPTVIIEDGPAGIGSAQWFIHNNGEHYFPLVDSREDLHEDLLLLVFVVSRRNNTDRMSGYVFIEADHRGGLDHVFGVAVTQKFRSVMWELGGHLISEGSTR